MKLSKSIAPTLLTRYAQRATVALTVLGAFTMLVALAPRGASADPPDRHGAAESSAPGASGSAPSSDPAPTADASQLHAATGHRASPGARCREQAPQTFLIRTNYIRRGGASAEEGRRRHEAHARAIRYRTEQYGYFEGFGSPAWNSNTPSSFVETVSFMGRRVRMHRRVIPALQCVEAELRHSCSAHPYQPHALAGIRMQNTYHTGEVTNHAYGIAIDVDPDRNTCCGCVGHWAEHPLCHRPVNSVWEQMAMPECWVNVFERFGFYWLGHDPMHDTMHFEFLGDPDRILR